MKVFVQCVCNAGERAAVASQYSPSMKVVDVAVF